MSVSRIPNPIKHPPSALLGAVQSDACETAELGEVIVDNVTVIARLDAMSDAEFVEAARLTRELERLCPQAANLTRLIRQRIERGLEWDSDEDQHRGTIAAAGEEVETRGRRTVTVIQAYYAGPNGGAA